MTLDVRLTQPPLCAASELQAFLAGKAAFWKREVGPAGARWIEPVDQDRAALARWNEGTL